LPESQTKNEGQVALEMGNSPTVVKDHYFEIVDEPAAKAYWSLKPLPTTTGKSSRSHRSDRSQGRRGNGRKTFVDQKKFVVRRADLEFGIGNNGSALRRIIDKVTSIPVQ
jgi:hypothetical protein